METTLTNEERLAQYIAKQVAARPIEAKLVRKIVKALKASGNPVVSVWDGEESNDIESIEDVFENVFNLDEAHLVTKSGAWVFLVMGQDYEMLSDYNVSLEDALKPVNAYIEKHLF